MEHGVMESLCDVFQRRGFLADYFRFTGRIRCTVSEGDVKDPVGIVGAALET